MLPAYLSLAELGYAIFPIAPGRKTPLTDHGCKDATTDAETIERWWSKWPDANIGLATQGLLVVDIDVDGSGQNNPWLAQEVDKACDLLAAPMSLTPRGGRHFVFRQPDGWQLGNTAGKLAEHVDTRANGGYIVVAPSKLCDGREYKWVGNGLDCPPTELPLPPAWLLTLLSDDQSKPGPRSDIPEPGRKIPSGRRNAALATFAGAMRRHGMTADEMLPSLLQANQRCEPPLDASEVAAIALSIAKYAPDDASLAVKQIEAQAEARSVEGPADPGSFPNELLSVPGFIGEVMDYNLETAFRPQPAIALAGALCLLSALTGRKIRDVYDTRTNLFCIATCNTSMGKDHPRKLNKDILHLAGLEPLIGPETIESASGVISALDACPSILLQLDEFGRHLATMNDASKNFLYNIPTTLMKLFTSANQLYSGGAYADMKKNKRIDQPHAVIFATTTPDAYFNSLSNNSVLDGLFSRLLVFEGHDVEKRLLPARDAPATLIEQARWWGDFKPGGNLQGVTAQPATVDMTSDAQRVVMDYDTLWEVRRKELGNPLGSIWPRGTEKANKLALLYACSDNPAAPLVDEAAAKWACAVVDYLTARLVYQASRWLSENKIESQSKRVARIIEDAGPNGLSKSQLAGVARWLKARERNEIIDTLVECGEIVIKDETSGGRPRVVLIHRIHA